MIEIKLQRVNCPEEAGVSSRELVEFIEDLIKNNLEYHSLMILRRGKVAYESYVSPYSADMPHAMYSASKSVTSTAVGFAVTEGLLSLDTKVVDIFPDYLPEKQDKWLEEITVRHLLTMSAGKEPKLITDKTKVDWIEEFMTAPWKFEPGTSFRYTSENMFILCAMIVRKSGMSVVDYLMPRLFIPLGINKPVWETDHNGIEGGGWGLFLKTEDLAKYTLCYSNNGKFNGAQVIPEEWVLSSVSKQIDNALNFGYDTNKGYGYCFWRNSLADTYRVDGMFSQFGIVLSKYDACIIMTGGQLDERGRVRQCIWRHFPNAFMDNAIADERITAQLNLLSNRSLSILPSLPHSNLEKEISGKLIKTKRSKLLDILGMKQSILPFPVLFMARDRAGDIDNIKLDFVENDLIFSWTERDESNSVKCSMQGKYTYGRIKLASLDLTTVSIAAWRARNVLEISVRALETIASRNIKFIFKGKKIKILLRSTPSMQEIAEEVADGSFPDLIRNKLILKSGQFLLKNIYTVLEPKIKGRFIE